MTVRKLATIFQAVLLLTISFGICSQEVVREFNPLFEISYFEPKQQGLEGSLGIKYEVAYTSRLNDPLSGSSDRPTAIIGSLTFWNINLFSSGNFPFKEDFPVGNFNETGIDIGGTRAKLATNQPCDKVFCDDQIDSGSFIFKYAGSYQFESDRDFDNKQHAYGLKARAAYMTHEGSNLQYFNPLEWIPSLIKIAIGDGIRLGDNKIIVAPEPFSERFLPSVNIAVEQINPENDEQRMAVDPQLEDYQRARLELGYSSTLFGVGDGDVYRVSFTYRYFRELSPEEAIQQADLDRFSYRTLALHTPDDVVISYSKGQLPFDREEESLFKVGWQFHF